MVDKLISSYRAKIYDWTLSQWVTFWKSKKKLIIAYLFFVMALAGLFVFGVKIQSSLIMLLIFLIEAISLLMLDRYTVKHHDQFLRNRQNRLSETKSFLQDTIPNVNLYQARTLDELIGRLSDRIDERIPFKNFLKSIKDFAKAIVLPVVTYIAGVYSGGLEKINVDIVVSYGISIILLLGVIRLAWGGFSEVTKTFFCRDYNAAIALREDLLDLRLLYFSSSDNNEKDASPN